MVELAIHDLLPDFRDAAGAKGIGGSGPAQGWFRFLVGLQQWLIGPFGRERGILVNAVGSIENSPGATSGVSECLFNKLDRFVHRFQPPRMRIQD